ncbi:uncharacterized protein LOC126743253 [Anthonomus grandis grandis]|uniref:uncharacterized protein LOC126743253 n=1 Tax=Anthonomus grandis grandis TaxID=2921223 RepID=UPI0021655597|nr:uncharacterized protein LOC126743253 [Anthonomus grandis grandis]XP_050306208.1 uncharacterized protein LOC126743253 [Anthonomus grandis grandis]
MVFELTLLGALIFIFIISFCGLLQKIRQTYDRERLLAERIARRRAQERIQRHSNDSFAEVYMNGDNNNGSIFPEAPPPYSHYNIEPPPKYDEVVKVHQSSGNSQNENAPPPYSISITIENPEPVNRI